MIGRRRCCCDPGICPPDEQTLVVSGVVDSYCAGAADDRYNGTFASLQTYQEQVGGGYHHPLSLAWDDPSITGTVKCWFALGTYGDSGIHPTWPGYMRWLTGIPQCFRSTSVPWAFTVRVNDDRHYWVHVNTEYYTGYSAPKPGGGFGPVRYLYRWAFRSDGEFDSGSPLSFTYQHLWKFDDGLGSDPGLAAMPIDASGATIEIHY